MPCNCWPIHQACAAAALVWWCPPGYTPAIGQALQIIGVDQTVDVNTLKPVLTAELDAGQVIVRWTKQGMDGLEIWVDCGEGFMFLAIDTIPDYTDSKGLPAAGTSALWEYKAIYLQTDQRGGQWSDVVRFKTG